ncbi:hypothetical protein TSMEX_003454 [Taenia solium]|eukprot:TsM_000755400 transcript=TsM_000755400 gene=TsM_000755400
MIRSEMCPIVAFLIISELGAPGSAKLFLLKRLPHRLHFRVKPFVSQLFISGGRTSLTTYKRAQACGFSLRLCSGAHFNKIIVKHLSCQ